MILVWDLDHDIGLGHTTSLGFRGMESGTGMIATGRQQSGKQLSGAFLLGLCCDVWSLSSILVFLGAGFDTLWITRGHTFF